MNAIHVTGIVESTVLQVHTEADRLAFEESPVDEECLNAVFRATDAIKGKANASTPRLSDNAGSGEGE